MADNFGRVVFNEQKAMAYLSGEITEQTAQDINGFFLKVFSNSYVQTPPILIIDSNGGDVDAFMSMYDTLSMLPPIYRVVTGKACSGACWLTLSGQVGFRFAMPHSYMMLHSMSYGLVGKHEDISNTVQEYARQQGLLNQIIIHHTNITKTEVEEKFGKGDWYMTPKEALQKGVIDAIVNPNLLGQLFGAQVADVVEQPVKRPEKPKGKTKSKK